MHRGGKHKRKGKKSSGGPTQIVKRDADQEYGWVLKILGDCRMQCLCSDEKIRICHIRGSMRKRVWINVEDVVLLSIRDFQDDKADIIHKYNQQHADNLKDCGDFDPQEIQKRLNTKHSNVYETGLKEGDITDENLDISGDIVIDFSTL